MKSTLNLFGVLTLGMMTCWAMSFTVQAQEDEPIVIINQDGEKVKPSVIRVQGFANGGKVVGGKQKGTGGIFVQSKDGKLSVKDADGNTRELDIEGARSITVNQAEQVIVNDGERQTKRIGKAIVIGPDGERHEIELGGDGGLPGFAGIVKAERVNNRFMIGVNCEPVGEALRSQLQLEPETGLVVAQVSKESPAEAAGIKNHDILMFADDRQLIKQSDLSEAVQVAGQEKTKVSLTLIRGGKEIGIEVTPTERSESDFTGMEMPKLFMFDRAGGPGRFNMQFRQMGPGVIFEGKLDEEGFHKDMEKQMQAMQEQMEAMRLQMQQQFENDKN